MDLVPVDAFWACRLDGSGADDGPGREGEEGREGSTTPSAKTVPRVRSAFQWPAHNARTGAATSSRVRAEAHSSGKKVLKYRFLRGKSAARGSEVKRLVKIERAVEQAEARMSFHCEMVMREPS